MLNAILRLRRDNDYNYAKIKDTFIPANGEVCLVDTARDGLRAVCGDGITPFGQLKFMNELLVIGYYYDGEFYAEAEHTTLIKRSSIKLYIDKQTNSLYYFDGIDYSQLGGTGGTAIPTATAKVPGIMKLYDTVGTNTDGTMTQKAITDELDDKVEISLNLEEELLIFSN